MEAINVHIFCHLIFALVLMVSFVSSICKQRDVAKDILPGKTLHNPVFQSNVIPVGTLHDPVSQLDVVPVGTLHDLVSQLDVTPVGTSQIWYLSPSSPISFIPDVVSPK